jgi:hypothetical protein
MADPLHRAPDQKLALGYGAQPAQAALASASLGQLLVVRAPPGAGR